MQDEACDSSSSLVRASSPTPLEMATATSVLTLEDLGKGVVVSNGWVYRTCSTLETTIQFIKIKAVAITHSVTVYPDLSWMVHMPV